MSVAFALKQLVYLHNNHHMGHHHFCGNWTQLSGGIHGDPEDIARAPVLLTNLVPGVEVGVALMMLLLMCLQGLC
jgi:hypothetical protein